MEIRLIAIDPGQTTGYVDVLYDPANGDWRVVDAKEIAWVNRFTLRPLLADPFIGLPLPSFVVCEQFTLYAHKAYDQVGSHFPAVRVIGTLEAYLDELGILDRLIFQGASVRERVTVLDKHASMIHGPHITDAYQHVRYFIVTNAEKLRREQV